MINEEVTRQVIAVKKKALHLTAREVIKLMKMILNKAEKEKNGLKDFIGIRIVLRCGSRCRFRQSS